MADYDRLRKERDFRMNPPSNEPGQGSGEGWDNVFSDSSTNTAGNEDSFNGNSGISSDSIDSILNGSNSNNPNVPSNVQQGPVMNPNNGQGDKLEEFIGVALEGSFSFLFNFIKEATKTFTNNNALDWSKVGSQMRKNSYAIMAVSGAGLLLGVFFKSVHNVAETLCGGVLTFCIGSVIILANHNKVVELKKREMNDFEDSSVEDNIGIPQIPEDDGIDFSNFIDDDNEKEVTSDDDWSLDDTDYEEEFESWGGYMDEDEEKLDVDESELDIDEEFEKVPKIDSGTQTREYLIEQFTRVLPNMHPKFNSMIDIDVEDEEFFRFEGYLRDACEQVGLSEEKTPNLLSVQYNLFIIQMEVERPSGIKEQEIANEIARQYGVDENRNIKEVDEDGILKKKITYATVELELGKFYINIFKGDNVMVSLGDIYGKIGKFIRNPNTKMPLVWGVNESGEVICCDGDNLFSIIISGTPRGGKSWKGQSLILQLCMFNSPNDVVFYVFDKKRTSSDYYYMTDVLPHIKGFCGDVNRINSELSSLIKREKARREKILADNNCISIKDYREENPTATDMPYLYIVIDEIMGLLSAYDKEQKAEFNRIVSELASQLANLGFRLLFFPHRIVNDIISKNVYTLVPCKVVVKQPDFKVIEASTGATKANFPYVLSTPGDMAISCTEVAGGEVTYCHAEAITSNNNMNKKVFKYVGDVWRMLMPDCDTGINELDGSFTKRNISGGSSKSVRHRKARDNSKGNEDFSYDDLFNKSSGDVKADELFDEGELLNDVSNMDLSDLMED